MGRGPGEWEEQEQRPWGGRPGCSEAAAGGGPGGPWHWRGEGHRKALEGSGRSLWVRPAHGERVPLGREGQGGSEGGAPHGRGPKLLLALVYWSTSCSPTSRQGEPKTGAEVRLDVLPGSSLPRLTLPSSGASWPPRCLTAHGSRRAGRATWGRMSGRQLHAA